MINNKKLRVESTQCNKIKQKARNLKNVYAFSLCEELIIGELA